MSALRPFIPHYRICGLATINLCSSIGLFRAFMFPQKPSGKHRGNIFGWRGKGTAYRKSSFLKTASALAGLRQARPPANGAILLLIASAVRASQQALTARHAPRARGSPSPGSAPASSSRRGQVTRQLRPQRPCSQWLGRIAKICSARDCHPETLTSRSQTPRAVSLGVLGDVAELSSRRGTWPLQDTKRVERLLCFVITSMGTSQPAKLLLLRADHAPICAAFHCVASRNVSVTSSENVVPRQA